jgi:hypothetical protein
MQVLGIEKDVDLLGRADPMGRELQDSRLRLHNKGPARTQASGILQPANDGDAGLQLRRMIEDQDKLRKTLNRTGPVRDPQKTLRQIEDAERWIEKGGFADSQKLAALIDSANLLRKPPR